MNKVCKGLVYNDSSMVKLMGEGSTSGIDPDGLIVSKFQDFTELDGYS